MKTYPPINAPDIDQAAHIRRHSLPADFYTSGLYASDAFRAADDRLSHAMKARLPQARINAARDAREAAWRDMVDAARTDAAHEAGMKAAYGDHGQG